MATVLEVLAGAYAKSTKNQPDDLATVAGAHIAVVNHRVRALFALTARVNPFFYAVNSAVAMVGNRWARPAAAEAVFWIEMNGNEVAVVPFNDREAEPNMPSLYMLGGHYYAAGNPGDPSNENLTFYYSDRSTALVAIGDSIDARFPDSVLELLEYEVATYLALKDDRAGELSSLQGERDTWLRLYMMHLEHVNASERRRFDLVKLINSNSLVPISKLVAGGSGL
jgi:hypothetical protein